MAPHYANWPLWLDCSVGLIAQIIPFFMKAEVYLGLSLISNVALPGWHAYKCLSCQLFFFLFYAALMFHADDAHTQYTHTYLRINKMFHCAPFLASLQAVDSPSLSSCLGKQRAFRKGVRQKTNNLWWWLFCQLTLGIWLFPRSSWLRDTKTPFVIHSPPLSYRTNKSKNIFYYAVVTGDSGLATVMDKKTSRIDFSVLLFTCRDLMY